MAKWNPKTLLWAAIDNFTQGSGTKAEFLVMTPGFCEKLVKALHGEGGAELERLEMAPSNDPVAYAGMQIVVADLPSFAPVLVCGSVPDMMALHGLKMRPEDEEYAQNDSSN